MKKIFIIHGWGGSPQEEIHKWMKKELESHGFEVHALTMPNTDTPKIEEWIPHLQREAPNPDKETFFFGHSIGCQTILRYLQTLPEKTKVGGAVLLAPWMNLLDTAFEEPEKEKPIAKPWEETPIDWEKVKSHTANFIWIFSDNDPCVPLSDKKIFEKVLGGTFIIEHDKGHFTMEDEISQTPSALKALLEMSNPKESRTTPILGGDQESGTPTEDS